MTPETTEQAYERSQSSHRAYLQAQIAIGKRELQRARERTFWLSGEARQDSTFTGVAIEDRIHELERRLAQVGVLEGMDG